MCQWNDVLQLRVPVAGTDPLVWKVRPVDRCIAPIVQALNDAGIHTAACCCGHGRAAGSIILHDDRWLLLDSTPAPDVTHVRLVDGNKWLVSVVTSSAELVERIRRAVDGREVD